jgi:hypothetical protein
MPSAAQKVIAHIKKLEAERRAALYISQEKAEEAKLIEARQQGLQEALELLGLETTQTPIEERKDEAPKRARRNIPDLVLRELSFSGRSMSKDQVAKAIGYLPSHTERALKRLESSGRVMQNRDGRWEVVTPVAVQPNGHARRPPNEDLISNASDTTSPL